MQTLTRWYNNDSRSATIEYIENTLNNTLFITNLILKNETEKQLSNKQKKQNLVKSISEMNIIENLHFKEGNSQLLKRFYLEMINARWIKKFKSYLSNRYIYKHRKFKLYR